MFPVCLLLLSIPSPPPQDQEMEQRQEGCGIHARGHGRMILYGDLPLVEPTRNPKLPSLHLEASFEPAFREAVWACQDLGATDPMSPTSLLTIPTSFCAFPPTSPSLVQNIIFPCLNYILNSVLLSSSTRWGEESVYSYYYYYYQREQ